MSEKIKTPEKNTFLFKKGDNVARADGKNFVGSFYLTGLGNRDFEDPIGKVVSRKVQRIRGEVVNVYKVKIDFFGVPHYATYQESFLSPHQSF